MTKILSILKNLLVRGAPESLGAGAAVLLLYHLVDRLLEKETSQFCITGDSAALALFVAAIAVVVWVKFAYRQPPPPGDWRG